MVMKLLQIENNKNHKLLYLDTHPVRKKYKEKKGKDIMKIVCFLGTISTSKV